MSLRKNDVCTLTLTGYTAEGYGVGRTEDGLAVFVPGGARGDRAEIQLLKVRKSYAFGKLLRLVEPAPCRMAVDCPVFAQCGGCDFRHVTYEEELSLKALRVQDAMNRLGGFSLPLPEIVPSPLPDGYRNKAMFPVARQNGKTVFGFYRSRSHQLIPFDRCRLQPGRFSRVAEAVCGWADEAGVSVYQEETGRGLLRHIYLREGRGGVQLTLVCNGNALPGEALLIQRCRAAEPSLCGIVLNENRERSNRILGPVCRTVWGEGRLEDTLAGHSFRLSPLSFYQVNHDQTEQLYGEIVRLAAPEGTGTVLDLYCGVGTITLALAEHCRGVTGVELVPEAIEDAKDNAARNGIFNARFFCADAGQAALRLAEEQFLPEAVVVDPPRKGIDLAAVEAICAMQPRRIVYVACDPASLARDARLLCDRGGYQVTAIKAFDMFPKTANVETVVLLLRETYPQSIEVKIDVSDGEVTEKPTYKRIQEYVEKNYGFKVHTAYIAEVKRMCGLDMHKAPNAVEQRKHQYHPCPPEKVDAIKDALRHFGMI